MDLLERRRLMMGASEKWDVYTLTNQSAQLDTGLVLYGKREWVLDATFTVTSATLGRIPVVFGIGGNPSNSVQPYVRVTSSTVYLGTQSVRVAALNTTLTLTANWKSGTGGSISLTGTGVNLSDSIGAGVTSSDTLRLFTSGAGNGTVYSLTIRYKD